MNIALICLIATVAAEVLRLVAGRRKPAGRLGRIAALLTWLMRPIAAACAVNVVFRLGGFSFSNAATYPFYANEWWPQDWNAAMRFKAILSSEGILWLPVAVILAAIGVGAAFCVSRHAKRLREGRGHSPGWAFALMAPILAVAFCFSFLVAVNCLPLGLFTGEGQRSAFLANWHESGGTMLYAIPAMQPNVKAYWKNFHKIQPRLGITIHAKSHPPVASSFVRWIGKLFGVDVNDQKSYRDAHARLRYALGQTFFTSLNALLVFAIGLAMFDWRTGLFASILWSIAPSVCGYGTFAPDMNYALFFHGAILFTWLVATERRMSRALLWGVPLGLCFTMLALMTFSWCIMTTMSAAFILVAGVQSRRSLRETAMRAALPLAVMALASGYAIIHYQIHYLTIYRTATAFVARFYLKHSFWEKAMAFVGGQAEWLTLLGPLTCSGFFLWLRGAGKDPDMDGPEAGAAQRLYALTLLGVFLIPVLLGPACLKHEVARCWIWMAAVPVVLAARHWLTKGSPAMCAAAAAASAVMSISLRLLLRFLA